MNWLAQNWIWIALAVGGIYFMTRMGGCGIGHSGGHRQHDDGQDHVHDHGHDMRDMPSQAAGSSAAPPFDPVTGHGLAAAGGTISSVYHGRAYHFENRENRDAFESDPEKYLARTQVVGEPVGAEHAYADRPRHRGGC